MADLDLEKLLEPHSRELTKIAEAAAAGERNKVIDGVAGVVLTIATGNPVVGALAPLARKGIAAAFGNAADRMFAEELAKMEKEDERTAFLGQIDSVVATLLGQAVVQLVRTQHNVKEEVFAAVGGVRKDFEHFRLDFETQVRATKETVIVDKQIVGSQGLGVRVRNSTTKSVHIKVQTVEGDGAVGIELE